MAKVQCPDCGFEQELPFRDSDNPDEKDVECARCGYVLFGPSLSQRGRDKYIEEHYRR